MVRKIPCIRTSSAWGIGNGPGACTAGVWQRSAPGPTNQTPEPCGPGRKLEPALPPRVRSPREHGPPVRTAPSATTQPDPSLQGTSLALPACPSYWPPELSEVPRSRRIYHTSCNQCLAHLTSPARSGQTYITVCFDSCTSQVVSLEGRDWVCRLPQYPVPGTEKVNTDHSPKHQDCGDSP